MEPENHHLKKKSVVDPLWVPLILKGCALLVIESRSLINEPSRRNAHGRPRVWCKIIEDPANTRTGKRESCFRCFYIVVCLRVLQALSGLSCFHVGAFSFRARFLFSQFSCFCVPFSRVSRIRELFPRFLGSTCVHMCVCVSLTVLVLLLPRFCVRGRLSAFRFATAEASG